MMNSPQEAKYLIHKALIKARKKMNDIWKLTVKDPTHNHKPSTVASAHPIHCCMPTEVKDQVKQLMAVSITARQVALVVYQATDHPIIA